MDPTSESPPKGKSFDPGKIRFKYARRWYVIGFALGMGTVEAWNDRGWPLWQACLIIIAIGFTAHWLMSNDTK